MYICTCICVYMYMHMYTREGICMHMYSCVWVNINVCIADRSAAPRKFYVCQSVALNFTLSSLYYHCISVRVHMYVKNEYLYRYIYVIKYFTFVYLEFVVCSIHVCVYVWIYVCMHVFMHACMYVCIHIYMYACMKIWKYLVGVHFTAGNDISEKGCGGGLDAPVCDTYSHTNANIYTKIHTKKRTYTRVCTHINILICWACASRCSSTCVFQMHLSNRCDVTSHVQIQYWHLCRDDVQRRAGTRTRKCRIYVTCSFAWRVHSRR